MRARQRKRLRTCRSLFANARGSNSADRVRHAVECGLQIRADQLHGGDDDHGNARRDQAILDGSRTGIIPHKTAKQALNRLLPLFKHRLAPSAGAPQSERRGQHRRKTFRSAQAGRRNSSQCRPSRPQTRLNSRSPQPRQCNVYHRGEFCAGELVVSPAAQPTSRGRAGRSRSPANRCRAPRRRPARR